MDSENVDTTQQVTSKVPTTHVKNPNRVTAGKLNAEKRWLAREAQKQKIAEAEQKMAEAEIVLANDRLKKAQEEATPAATPDTPKETVSQTLSTSQWLSVIAIGVSMVGVYYNRQALKNSFYKIKDSVKPAPASATASANASATAPRPVNKTPKKVGIRTMA